MNKPTNFATNFAERLTEAMFYANNMSSAALADAVGVTVQTVRRWKRGEKQINLANLIKVANVLNCTIDYLVGRRDNALDFTPKQSLSFYQSLGEVLTLRGKTFYNLTQQTRFTESYLYQWRKGKQPKIPALIDLANYLDCSIDYLVGRER
ncbi:MAG: helix-turn-helix transcriptional regulator [Clostridia bacterium]